MGHERIGLLPKSKKWREIVQDLSAPGLDDAEIVEIASRTLNNVRNRFTLLASDQGVRAAFEFLALFSVSMREEEPQGFLSERGVDSASFTPIQLAKAVNEWVEQRSIVKEYGRMAARAAADSFASWLSGGATGQLLLGQYPEHPSDRWRPLGRAGGFCELSRLFFAKLTERYLNYFLEREASAALPSIAAREHFGQQIGAHTDAVSLHAFEASKITQSFAAGWFNRYVAHGALEGKAVEAFVGHAFHKMREELLVEEAVR